MQRTLVLRGLDMQYVYTFTSIKKSLENEQILTLIVSFFIIVDAMCFFVIKRSSLAEFIQNLLNRV